jgi:cell wall-associated NlpC family hydrolase
MSPLPGDWAVCSVGGPAGRAIEVAEYLNGDGFAPWEHAFVYVGDGKILQAEPGGSRIVPYTEHGAELWSTGKIPLTAAQRAQVPVLAGQLKGVPYSWLDYASLAGHRLHIPDLPLWPGPHHPVTLKTFIGDSGHLICSQLVDYFMLRLGVHLFKDGRWPGFVTPAALAELLA